MAYGLFQGLDNSTQHTLVDFDEGGGNIKCITICNAHASTEATLRLYLITATEHPSAGVSILENFKLPAGVTVQINEGVSFNNRQYKLMLDIAEASVDINVIIK